MSEASASVGIVKTNKAKISLPPGGFRLATGGVLTELEVAYETYGTLSAERDNAIFICPTLTSDAHAAGYHSETDTTPGWWDELIGPGKAVDTSYYHVVCANILGGCMGTTGPSSINPATGAPYGSGFPDFTVPDVVDVHRLLLKHLGIERLAAVIGGSLGGMQALEWALRYPDMLDRCICIASGKSLSAQALAFDIVGREAITSDPSWQSGDYYGTGKTPDKGLSLARKIGHITYLSAEMMESKFGREKGTGTSENGGAGTRFQSDFEVERYLAYQGEKFVKRFDANSYLHITMAMDHYDLVEKHGSPESAFEDIRANVLMVALSADWLFPSEQSVELANALLRAGKRVSYCELQAPHGHDAFLLGIQHLSEVVRAFLPWVAKDGTSAVSAKFHHRSCLCGRREIELIVDMISPGSKVVDLGCGDGALLSTLSDRRGALGLGVEIDINRVVSVMDKGHDVFHGDIDAGLAMIPDGAYDYAILGETLQVVKKPKFVLNEMLRVAKEGIVSFPNIGKWSHRLRLLLSGRMPKGGALPYEWHETPNIHTFTLKDFIELCNQEGIKILELSPIPSGIVGKILILLGLCNLGADRVLVKVARDPAICGTRQDCAELRRSV